MTPDSAEQIIAALHTRIDELIVEKDSLQYEVDAIPAIKAQRDALAADIRQMSDDLVAIEKLRREKDARMYADMHKLKEAAKRALDSAVDVYATCDWYGDGDQKAMESLSKAITALRQAGVQ